MRLSRALIDKLMDVRVREKLIAEGKISEAEVDKWLASLPDETDNLTYVKDEQKSRSAAESPKDTDDQTILG